MIFKAEQQALPEIKPLKKLKKRARSRFDGRWTIVGLFFLTLGASLFFYFSAEAPQLWQKISQPMIISSLSEKEKLDPSPVLEKINTLTKDLRGEYGVYVERLETGRSYGVREKEVFPAASLIKLPVILSLYQEVEKGRLDLESKYVLDEKDKVGGAGVLQSKKSGTTYTYRQLAQYMGQHSDNTAFKVLRKILGDEAIETAIRSLGMKKTSLKKNKTTPEDMGLFFQKLYKGKVVSPKHQEEVLGFLTKTDFEKRIPAGIPPGVRVAHKIGTEIGSFSDAGIVFAQKPFVLVIMSKAARESEAREALPKIAQLIWEFETSQ